ncbi:hypothetical protein [Actinomadura fulvescens]|uniref:Uncharacterized protein n=1 Tax=Actinomadura fulvescens TaxID=46160 RepID=A0ABN3QUS6_9ACTN
MVPSLDRYGRSLKDLITMVADLRTRGRTGGRPTVVDAGLLKAARDLLPDPGRSVTSIAKLLGISVGTLYNHIPDLQQLRAAGAAAVEPATTADR